VSCSVVGGGAG